MILFEVDGVLEFRGPHIEAIKLLERGGHEFGHHSTPSNEFGLYASAALLFKVDEGLEKSIQMLVSRVILFDKGVIPYGQVGTELWSVVIA